MSEGVERPGETPLRGLRRLSRAESAVRRGVQRLAPPRSQSEPQTPALEDEPAGESPPEDGFSLGRAARVTAVVTLVALAIVAVALALWKVRLIVTLLFLAFTIAAAMRPGVDALRRAGIPRGVGILMHYVAFLGVIALFLWLVVPQAIDQVQSALNEDAIGEAARESTGIKQDILAAIDRQLSNLPSGSEIIRPAAAYGRTAAGIVIGLFFTFAAAAYWLYERDRAVNVVASLVSRPKRKRLRDTWNLIDLRLGAFVRGQLILVLLVGLVLSGAFWAIGLPYWLLVGAFSGVVEIVPVIGPLAAAAVAIGVGLTESIQLAAIAAIVVLVVQLLQNYLVGPHVFSRAVSISPLVVLVSVTTVGVLFGGFAVILAIPIASVVTTLIDVLVRDRDPELESAPKVIFTAKDDE